MTVTQLLLLGHSFTEAQSEGLILGRVQSLQ
jgi:hypothetical protein